MNVYKAVFFDFGDTLAPTSPVPLSKRLRMTFEEAGLARALGLDLPDDETLQNFHEECAALAGWPVDPGWEDQYKSFYDRWAAILLKRLNAETVKAADAAPEFAETFRDISDRSRIAFEDCVPMLEKLRAMGLRLAIVSNNDGTLARRMKYMKLFDYFEIVVDSAIVRSNKPDAGIFKHALEATGMKPAHVLHVGDLYDADVEGSAALGMDAAWINRGYAPFPESKHRPHFVIRSLLELPDLVQAADLANGKKRPSSANLRRP